MERNLMGTQSKRSLKYLLCKPDPGQFVQSVKNDICYFMILQFIVIQYLYENLSKSLSKIVKEKSV